MVGAAAHAIPGRAVVNDQRTLDMDGGRTEPRTVTIVASDVAPIGGMDRAMHALTVRLVERGWRLTIITRRCDIEP